MKDELNKAIDNKIMHWHADFTLNYDSTYTHQIQIIVIGVINY